MQGLGRPQCAHLQAPVPSGYVSFSWTLMLLPPNISLSHTYDVTPTPPLPHPRPLHFLLLAHDRTLGNAPLAFSDVFRPFFWALISDNHCTGTGGRITEFASLFSRIQLFFMKTPTPPRPHKPLISPRLLGHIKYYKSSIRDRGGPMTLSPRAGP